MRLSVALTLSLMATSALAAQDVEMLGRYYGTRPPQAYYDQMARDPDAFSFSRGRATRLGGLTPLELARGADPADPGVAGAPLRTRAVVGTTRVPVVLGLFSDSPDAAALPYGRDTLAADYFGNHAGSVTSFYSEVSGGRLTLLGDVFDWVRVARSRTQVTGGQRGLASGLTGPFIVEILEGLADVDWGPYDNDGPDGVPNSGDDDGYVDALAVIHPTSGAECGGFDQDDRIWSHKWSLTAAASGPHTTATPSANGGFIGIDDYFIQPIFDCDNLGLAKIGVFAHEAGHAFGLPDLYDTSPADGQHQGAGSWDLMAAGSFGCNNRNPARPCHMGAWSKMMLGWVDVTSLDPDTDHGVLTLPPVETSLQVWRVDANDGSGEFFLLENRQRIGFDTLVHEEGLLVWQIDPDWVEAQLEKNRVNAFAHQGVWLRQADGLDHLGRTTAGNRGDRGDPFPFVDETFGNDDFHAASDPSSRSYGGSSGVEGTATAVTILDARRQGDDVLFRLSTRYTTVSLASEGDEGNGGLFTVDDEEQPGAAPTYAAAPFEPRTVEAAAGDAVSDGVRRPFEAWADDVGANRRRIVETPLDDATLVARYSGVEMELGVEVRGGQDGIGPGNVTTTPATDDFWFREGTEVTLSANADHSFAFAGWTGDLAGSPNPAAVTMAAPVRAGADFDLTFMVASATVGVVASDDILLDLVVEDGTRPFAWSLAEGALPTGLVMNGRGEILGAALDFGSFPLTVEVADARGLRVQGLVSLEVAPPALPISLFAAPFLLTGEQLTLSQRLFLDHQGNGDGGLDLGDVRAWVLANPQLPFTAAVHRQRVRRTVVLRPGVDPEGGGR